ncbi:helix-turn-helix transcriptional regulator [Pseudomonas alliivorans]|nr:helix-turn-helix transcriptional regulator [Pseudomonas alliivorans]
MSIFQYAHYSFKEIEVAAEHYRPYGADLDIMNYPDERFQYCKKVCIFGKSFVCSSTSLTGWGYELKSEVDGFLVTLPQLGSITWKTGSATYKANPGALAIADQREVIAAIYSPGIRSISMYVENPEILKYLTLILGFEPKSRIRFFRSNIEEWEIRYITNIVNTFLDYAENSKTPLKNVANSLKESLVGFLLNNIPNSYTSVLSELDSVPKPTPYDIKYAAEFMTCNTDPELTVVDVANFAGISVRSLQIGFKRYKNMTPIQFLRQERLARAKKILSLPGSVHNPQAAAFQVGFLNYQVFCKYYTKTFGEHPKTTYQRANR